jgi:beta-glucosidase
MGLKSASKNQEQKNCLYKNPDFSIDDRVADLLIHMTLREKVAQMMCIWEEKQTMLFDARGKLDLRNLKTQFKTGLGQIARISDTNGGQNPVEMAELSNILQKFFV